jgi:hypothetical protein
MGGKVRAAAAVAAVLGWVVCGAAETAAAPPAAVAPGPAFEESLLVEFAAATAALAVNGAVTHEVVPDPRTPGAKSLLKVSYPAYVQGESEWPALKLPGSALATADWHGREYLLLRVFNPQDEVVDLGFYAAEGEAKHGPHVLLQPSAWSAVLLPLAEFAERKLALEQVGEVHVFMTRPAQALAILLESLSLVKERDIATDPFPAVLEIARFEKADDLKGWQATAVKARITDAARMAGKGALELAFPAFEPGLPRWPSLQARYADRSLPVRDWRGYERFCLDVRNPGRSEAPLRLCFRDLAGGRATVPATVAARDRLAFSVPLGGLGLDLSRVAQVDLFMSEPTEAHRLWIDSVRLEAEPFAAPDALLARLGQAVQEAERLGGRDLGLAYGRTREVLVAVRSGFEKQPTFGGAQVLAGAVTAASRQAGSLDRGLVAARLLASTRARVPEAAFGVGVADSMTKVMIRDQPLAGVMPTARVELDLARNEWEAFQVVVLGAVRHLARVRVEPGEFRHLRDGTALGGGAITASVVGYVKTRKPPYAVPYVGWWPDPILDFQQECAVEPGEAVPFWVRVQMPREAVPGRYEGTVTVRAEGAPEVPVPVSLRVFGFEMPDLSFLPTACSFYDNIRTIWGTGMDEGEYQRRLTDAALFLARYKIGLDHIYRQPKDDPAALDLPVAQLRLLKERGLLRRFMVFHVATPREATDVDDPAVQRTIDLCLRNLAHWVPRLQAEGLLEYAYLYGYDEVPAKAFAVIARVFGEIKKAYPALPLMTTAYDDGFGLDSGLAGVVDWWVPLTPKFDPERVARARAAKMDVWWYICIGPKHPYCNWLIEYPAIEARLLMGAMTAKYQPGGFLYYALTRWPVNKAPLTQGPYTDWDPMSYKDNNGDGSLFCAGPEGLLATQRAENFRDGMEDNDYFVLLRQALAQAEAVTPKSAALERAIRQAREASAVPASVVVSLTEYTREPAAVRTMRRQVAEAIEALQAALR